MIRIRKLELGNSTYGYGYDDCCLVLRSGSDVNNSKIWLSNKIIEWIIKNQKIILNKITR